MKTDRQDKMEVDQQNSKTQAANLQKAEISVNPGATAATLQPIMAMKTSAMPSHKSSFEEIKKRLQSFNSIATPCHATSQYVMHLLTGTQEKSLYTREGMRRKPGLNYTLKLPALNPDEEYVGTFKGFTEKEDGSYKNPVAKELFTNASAGKHLVFYIVTEDPKNYADHSYVIEKQNSGQCRMYQSFYKGFSIAQWLGNEPWLKEENGDWWYGDAYEKFIQQFNDYGSGKLVDQSKIIAFIQGLPSISLQRRTPFPTDFDTVNFYIYMMPYKPAI